MTTVRVWLSRRGMQIICKAARKEGLTPSQFMAKASIEYAKAIPDRIEESKSDASSLGDSKPSPRACRPRERRQRSSFSSRTGTSAYV